MSLTDFYKGTTKNFQLTLIVQNEYPDITPDTMILKMYNSGSGNTYTSSADVSTSGSGGIE